MKYRLNSHRKIQNTKTELFNITKTCLYTFDPLKKPHFYIVKLGFTGVYIIFSSAVFEENNEVLS